MTLTQLLDKAGIATYYRHLYFTGCAVKGSVLFVPARDIGALIGRQFGADLRAVICDLSIRVAPTLTIHGEPPPKYLNAAGRKAWKAQQNDLLD